MNPLLTELKKKNNLTYRYNAQNCDSAKYIKYI